MLTVSRVHGALLLGSATPPHRSTTVSPPIVRQAEAPISPFSLKFFSKASATRSKPGRQVPPIAASLIVSAPAA